MIGSTVGSDFLPYDLDYDTDDEEEAPKEADAEGCSPSQQAMESTTTWIWMRRLKAIERFQLSHAGTTPQISKLEST